MVVSHTAGVAAHGVPAGDVELGPLLEPGSNGLAVDAATGDLLVCDHGNRRLAIVRRASTTSGFGGGMAADVVVDTVVDRVTVNNTARRFNSPNDLTLGRRGTLFFTDPSWGLKRTALTGPPEATPDRELPNGVYRVVSPVSSDGSVNWAHAKVDRVSAADGISKPNGIVLSPDGSRLYVSNSDSSDAVWTVRRPLQLLSCVPLAIVVGTQVTRRWRCALAGVPGGRRDAASWRRPAVCLREHPLGCAARERGGVGCG